MALTLDATWLTPRTDRPLLVVGPSLGTTGAGLWQGCVDALADRYAVVAWDLPGHGASPVGSAFVVADLAEAVLDVADRAQHDLGAAHGERDGRFAYAGDSLGGAVGLQLLIDVPDRVAAAVLVSTGARIGQPAAWTDRAATVRAQGTGAVVEGSQQRWFSARTRAERPEVVAGLLDTLRGVHPEGYAQACEALADFDVISVLGDIEVPVLAVAGAEDVPTPVSDLATIADGVRRGRLVVMDRVAHLPPAEAPVELADLISQHLTAEHLTGQHLTADPTGPP